LCTGQVESENSILERVEDEFEPSFQPAGLREIAASSEVLNASAQFADDLNRQEELVLVALEKIDNPGVGLEALAHFADDIRIEQKHG
jgi:hypothetical protein